MDGFLPAAVLAGKTDGSLFRPSIKRSCPGIAEAVSVSSWGREKIIS